MRLLFHASDLLKKRFKLALKCSRVLAGRAANHTFAA
jgi:hypothetical protein